MVIGFQQSLHLEIGSGVDGMEQRPFVVEWPVLSVQFAGNGPEGVHHNLLTGFDLFFLFLGVLATWGDDFSFADI